MDLWQFTALKQLHKSLAEHYYPVSFPASSIWNSVPGVYLDSKCKAVFLKFEIVSWKRKITECYSYSPEASQPWDGFLKSYFKTSVAFDS